MYHTIRIPGPIGAQRYTLPSSPAWELFLKNVAGTTEKWGGAEESGVGAGGGLISLAQGTWGAVSGSIKNPLQNP